MIPTSNTSATVANTTSLSSWTSSTKNSANHTPSSLIVTSSIYGLIFLSWFQISHLFTFFISPSFLNLSLITSILIVFLWLVCFRRFIRVDVWVRWFVKWGNIVTLLEDTLLCLLLLNPTEEEALVNSLVIWGFMWCDYDCWILGFDWFYAATELVTRSIKAMMESGCDEVCIIILCNYEFSDVIGLACFVRICRKIELK